jgi:hypothetical protein
LVGRSNRCSRAVSRRSTRAAADRGRSRKPGDGHPIAGELDDQAVDRPHLVVVDQAHLVTIVVYAKPLTPGSTVLGTRRAPGGAAERFRSSTMRLTTPVRLIPGG